MAECVDLWYPRYNPSLEEDVEKLQTTHVQLSLCSVSTHAIIGVILTDIAISSRHDRLQINALIRATLWLATRH